MSVSSNPSDHRDREKQFFDHVEKLLSDDRLRVDTTLGRKPVTTLHRGVVKTDAGVDLKRTMSQMNLPDRELQSRMPVGTVLDVTLSKRSFLIFKKTVGRLRIVSLPPTRSLLANEIPRALSSSEVQRILSETPPAPGGVPTTLVLMASGGFSPEAHELAERRADRTTILVAPNDAGGFNVHGPVETKALVDLFDPEAEDAKRNRIRAHIAENTVELSQGGIAADRLAARTQLSLQLVEVELRNYAKETPGLAAKRLDGRVVLFREGAAKLSAGGASMPFIDRMKTLFSRKGETEKKIALLAERRAALSQQRDRAYEDMGALEKQESSLRDEFKSATSALSKRRITSQLLQLQKDLARRQQLLGVFNQQINVVGTHLHNLELVQQGQSAKLPDTEELTRDAEAAEEMLASLQADTELAGTVGEIPHAGMTAEEQALYDELEREAGIGRTQMNDNKITLDTVEPEDTRSRESASRSPAKRAEPEAG